MDKIKLCMAEEVSSVTNEQVLNAVFEFYLQLNGLVDDANDERNFNFQPYLPCDKHR